MAQGGLHWGVAVCEGLPDLTVAQPAAGLMPVGPSTLQGSFVCPLSLPYSPLGPLQVHHGDKGS